jgi:hypothetical protein
MFGQLARDEFFNELAIPHGQPATLQGQPATFDEPFGQRLRLVGRPGSAGQCELRQVDQFVLKGQHCEEELLLGHDGFPA